MQFIRDLKYSLESHASPNNAAAMEKYMKYQFSFLGLKSPLRRMLLKGLWKEHSEKVKFHYREIALQLFSEAHREYHHCGMEILIKEIKNNYKKEDKELIEKLITTQSWWDTVDFLAKYLLGNYLLEYPNEKEALIKKYSDADSIWLNRSAILFQLNYRMHTDKGILFRECNKHRTSKEFFIQKAIGWALREYAKYNAADVLDFVESTDLKALSKREALKHQ